MGGGRGRVVTNRSRRRRLGLFSTQHSSRTHLARPLFLLSHTTRYYSHDDNTLGVILNGLSFCRVRVIFRESGDKSGIQPNVLDLSRIYCLLSENSISHILSNNPELVLKEQGCTYV